MKHARGMTEETLYVAQAMVQKKEFAKEIAVNAQNYVRKHHCVTKMNALLIETYHNAQKWYKKTN